MIGKTISHYKVIEKLGEGGMGVVYKAQDLKLDRFVALKFLPSHLTSSEENKQRFIHEAKATSVLDHNNICNIHEIDETADGQLFISMAYYEGATLREKIEKGPLKLTEALDIAGQIGAGLAKAHQQGIVHRDIKPGNIFITSDGVVKILDFGLAKLSGRTVLTKEGSTLGTVSYMSPEQISGETVDSRSDIWSLGVVIYEMLTAQLPFKGDYDQAVIYAIVNETADPVTGLRSGIPLELDRIIDKTLSKLANERYQHVEDLLTDLQRVTKEISAKRQDVRKLSKETRWKRPAIVSISAIVFLLAAFGLYEFLKEEDKSNSQPEYENSIAVLPFSTITKSEDDQIFTDGIHDDILTQLTNIRRLKVIARTSVLQYRNKTKRISEIGKELGVNFLLEGSVRRAGNQIRIVAQLIDQKTEGHVWAQTYDREYKDIFAIQSDVARTIARALRTQISEEEADLIEAIPTDNMEAYEYYQHGNYYWNNFDDSTGNQRAVDLYVQAVEHDPDFGLAYTRIAYICFYLAYDSKFKVDKNKDLAERALLKAQELAPDHWRTALATALSYYYRDRNPEKAFQILENALEIYPNNAGLIQEAGYMLIKLRRRDEALFYFKKQYEIDPGGWSGAYVGWVHVLKRQFENAQPWIDQFTFRNPNRSWGLILKAHLLAEGFGRVDEAIRVLEQGMPHLITNRGRIFRYLWQLWLYKREYEKSIQVLNSETQQRYYLRKAISYDLWGRKDRAKVYYDSARVDLEKQLAERVARLKRQGKEPIHNAESSIMLSLIYAGLGKKTEALSSARQAVHVRPNSAVNRSTLVYVLIKCGEYDEACEHLQTLLSKQGGAPVLSDQSCVVTVWTLKLDPRFDPLRNHERFKQLVIQYQ
jgi:serine/threonine protein kinase/Flp pilus assembly protein TadD